MDLTCDDNGNNVLNIDEEAYITYIHYINTTNDISMNDDENYMQKYYAPILSSNNYDDFYSGSEYDSAKQIVCCNKNIILDLLLNKLNSFESQVSLLFFVLHYKKLSTHMAHINEHIN